MTLIDKLKGEFKERKGLPMVQRATATGGTEPIPEDFILAVRFTGGNPAVIKVESIGDDYLIGYFKAITAESFSSVSETVSLNSIQRYRRV